MKSVSVVRTAVALLALGVAAAAFAVQPGHVTDLSAAQRPAGKVGPAVHNQNCPVPTRMPEQGYSGTYIDTGFVTVGIVDAGNLIWDGTGVFFDYTYNDVLTPGCYCEGWGAGDAIAGLYGYAGSDKGYQNVEVDSFTTTPSSAVSVVRIYNPSTERSFLRVTHDYHPSVTQNLLECTVTIQNISGATQDVRYRRAIDWDMTPTAFSELVTLKRNGAAKILYTSDNGFADLNPLSGPSALYFQGEAVDNGPADHGCLFDLGFGLVAPNQSVTFTFYIGGGMDQLEAMAALAQVGAEAYSLAKPDPNGGGGDRAESVDLGYYAGGWPNTAVFGLKGVGGRKIVAPQSFLDDTYRSALCVAWDPGYYQWTIMSGAGSYNTFVGLGQVLNANQKLVSFPTDPVALNFTFSKLQKKASGYFTDPYHNYSVLSDRLTTDDPPCGSEQVGKP